MSLSFNAFVVRDLLIKSGYRPLELLLLVHPNSFLQHFRVLMPIRLGFLRFLAECRHRKCKSKRISDYRTLKKPIMCFWNKEKKSKMKYKTLNITKTNKNPSINIFALVFIFISHSFFFFFFFEGINCLGELFFVVF